MENEMTQERLTRVMVQKRDVAGDQKHRIFITKQLHRQVHVGFITKVSAVIASTNH